QALELVQNRGEAVRHSASEAVREEQVSDADAAASHLVLVRGPDAAPRGADGGTAAHLLAEGVQELVPRKDDRGVLRDEQLLVLLEGAARFQAADLLEEDARVDDDAVADDAHLPGVEDAGRDQMQDGLLAAYDQGVAGIVAALKPDHDLRVLR